MTPPQPSIQQLEHAAKNMQRRIDSKKLEIDALSKMKDHAPFALAEMIHGCEMIPDSQDILRCATENFLAAKVNAGLVDLEELELRLMALKQAMSGILVPSGVRIG